MSGSAFSIYTAIGCKSNILCYVEKIVTMGAVLLPIPPSAPIKKVHTKDIHANRGEYVLIHRFYLDIS